MRKNENGKYEVYKYFKRSGHHFVGTGDTPEEAKKDLKRQLDQYKVKIGDGANAQNVYRLPLEPTGENIRSPGFSYFQKEKGGYSYRYNADRTFGVRANPTIAKAKREALEADKKEEENPS
jgi:hypothetical protein